MAELLRERGQDAISVHEIGAQGQSDWEQLERAQQDGRPHHGIRDPGSGIPSIMDVIFTDVNVIKRSPEQADDFFDFL